MRHFTLGRSSILVLCVVGAGAFASLAVAVPAAAQTDGDLVYVAGTDGRRPGAGEVTGGITAQVRQTLENLQATLKEEGMDLSHVVSANVYLTDARSFQAMNEVYRTFFAVDPPVRATVQADLPAPGALVQISLVAARPDAARRVIAPRGLQSPQLPYSWGILVGDTLFIAGATSRAPETYQPKPGDMAAQTRQVLENVGAVLDSAEMSHDDIVACKVFLDEARAFQAMNGVYGTFFPADPPARATVRARLMNPAFLSEIQCVAVKDSSRRVVIAEGATRSRSPLSPAIQVGSRLYLSGMTGRGADGYAPGDVEGQTRQALDNLRATLHAAGMDFTDVREAVVYVTDIRTAETVSDVYREVMGNAAPPTTTVGTPLMSPAALVEIMMTASR